MRLCASRNTQITHHVLNKANTTAHVTQKRGKTRQLIPACQDYPGQTNCDSWYDQKNHQHMLKMALRQTGIMLPYILLKDIFLDHRSHTSCGNSTLDCAIELVIHNYPANGNVFSLYRNLMLSFSSSSQKRQKKNDIGMLLYSCFTARVWTPCHQHHPHHIPKDKRHNAELLCGLTGFDYVINKNIKIT